MPAILKCLIVEDGGQGLVEYALIIFLVAMVALVGLKTFGGAIGNSLITSNAKLP